MDQPSQHAPRPRPCFSSAKRPVLHGTLARSRLDGPPPCQLALTVPTKPEVNLDCALAAARGCVLLSVPRRSPPPVSRHSYSPEPASSTHPSLALSCGLISAALPVQTLRRRFCELAPARPRIYSLLACQPASLPSSADRLASDAHCALTV